MNAYSTGQIAAKLGTTQSRVDRAIARAGVKPDAIAGVVRVFGPDAVEKVRREIARVDARRNPAAK